MTVLATPENSSAVSFSGCLRTCVYSDLREHLTDRIEWLAIVSDPEQLEDFQANIDTFSRDFAGSELISNEEVLNLTRQSTGSRRN